MSKRKAEEAGIASKDETAKRSKTEEVGIASEDEPVKKTEVKQNDDIIISKSRYGRNCRFLTKDGAVICDADFLAEKSDVLRAMLDADLADKKMSVAELQVDLTETERKQNDVATVLQIAKGVYTDDLMISGCWTLSMQRIQPVAELAMAWNLDVVLGFCANALTVYHSVEVARQWDDTSINVCKNKAQISLPEQHFKIIDLLCTWKQLNKAAEVAKSLVDAWARLDFIRWILRDKSLAQIMVHWPAVVLAAMSNSD